MDYADSNSLYVTNLPSSKIQKADLRTALYLLFSTYGPVLDVVALKTMKMRGQAHITFRDVQSATQAMRSLEGQSFLGRDLVSNPFCCDCFLSNFVSENTICQVKVQLCGQA